jgi:hypothetical protein
VIASHEAGSVEPLATRAVTISGGRVVGERRLVPTEEVSSPTPVPGALPVAAAEGHQSAAEEPPADSKGRVVHVA